MIEMFNELLSSFRLIVTAMFEEMEFAAGITVGWMLVALSCMAVVISYLFGRVK